MLQSWLSILSWMGQLWVSRHTKRKPHLAMSSTFSSLSSGIVRTNVAEWVTEIGSGVEWSGSTRETRAREDTLVGRPAEAGKVSEGSVTREGWKEGQSPAMATMADIRVQKKVEEALRSKMKSKALKECDHMIAKFAECAKGRTLSVVWTCRSQSRELNECLHQYTNDQVLAEYKRQYLADKDGD